jgi:DNA-binding CsgD family transcriptional regulator
MTQQAAIPRKPMRSFASKSSIPAKVMLVSTGKSPRHPGAMRVFRVSKKSLQLIVAPFRSDDFAMPGRAVAVVFINDPDEKPVPPREALRVLFNLTPAEGRLAISLLNGKSLAEWADLNRVVTETVRSQIKSIFRRSARRGRGNSSVSSLRYPAQINFDRSLIP